ncbi:MAG: hypothetical protein SFU25_02300 [Candidatus Caenarcaniphilales bacterium]|nr:hypothetical protein [Candidatus Caenarcaniphilales bacterium]
MNKYFIIGGACILLFGGVVSLNSVGQSNDPNAAPLPPPAGQMQNVAPPPPGMNNAANPSMNQGQNGQQMAEKAKEEEKIKPIIPEDLTGVPAKSKVVFKKDLIVPPNQTEVMLGAIGSRGFKTECKIKLATYSPGLRKVPAGTEFNVTDTRLGFGNETEVLIESTSLTSLSCITYKPGDPSQLMSMDGFKDTSYQQAQKASKGIIAIEVNSEPELITN